ncbi:MAG TPA: hypothetical protein H9946_04565 [Candidatus Jeotgalibaca pullicola]|nr:hypothetical protein [Candidatus Jeotgalibaca pullicola]
MSNEMKEQNKSISKRMKKLSRLTVEEKTNEIRYADLTDEEEELLNQLVQKVRNRMGMTFVTDAHQLSLLKEFNLQFDRLNGLQVLQEILNNEDYILTKSFPDIVLKKISNFPLYEEILPLTEADEKTRIWKEFLTKHSARLFHQLGYKKITTGLYNKKSIPEDLPYIFYIKYPRFVFGHETALYYHGITDVPPKKYVVKVEPSYNPRITIYPEQVEVIRSRDIVGEDEIVMVETAYGNKIPVTDIYRTLCDVMNPRYSTNEKVKGKVLMEYMKRNDAEPQILLQKARDMGIDQFILPIIEVLSDNEIR